MERFISRKITTKLEYLATKFPIVGLLGPRQSGKTTLLKHTFFDYPYISLEDLDHRTFAKEDPRGFLRTYMQNGRIILDEVQRVPELLSYLQTKVDESPSHGSVILSGSHNFLLNQHISQTLAGRIALLTLLPLSYSELANVEGAKESLDSLLFKGLYPRIYSENIDPRDWYPNYLTTYVERDVRQVVNIMDLSVFEKFIKLCAGRIGQLLNMTSLGNECGISHNTVRGWISLLEASYVLFLLQPNHMNFNKRLVKSPKLYFYDTGLACSLLGIKNDQQLSTHYAKGGLFESFVITEFMKGRLNQGLGSNLSFWRDSTGTEVDLILEDADTVTPIEIKSSQTASGEYFDGLLHWNAIAKASPSKNIVIYGGEENQSREKGRLISWRKIPVNEAQ